MHAGAAAELAHRVPQLRRDQCVDHDRGPAARLPDRDAQVLDVLDARVPDLDERLIGELRLERDDEPLCGLARGVGDDVELDRSALFVPGGSRVHGLRLAPRSRGRSCGSQGTPYDAPVSGRQLALLVALVLFVGWLEYGQRHVPGVPAAGAPASTKPYVWKVSLDPKGRPYDERIRPGVRVHRVPLAVLRAPSRRVLFLGGEYLSHPETDHNANVVLLEERPGRRYPVHAIWSVYPDGYEEIVGVVIVERDTPVVRWRELHNTAYGTDAGLGGITTVEWAVLPEEERRRHERALTEWQGQSAKFDVDGRPGIDTIGFSNGFGDGGFPSAAGYDASGARAAIAIWSLVVPWRLGFPEGKPPPQVTQRENQFAACLAGRRKVDGSTCRVVR